MPGAHKKTLKQSSGHKYARHITPQRAKKCLKVITFSHPDFTVGSGISPDQPLRARGLNAEHFTAGTEFHLSLKVLFFYHCIFYHLHLACYF